MKNMNEVRGRFALAAAMSVGISLGPCDFPDPHAQSNIKMGKGQGHTPKGKAGRTKQERNARKRARKARKKNR
jgi:hypothetical protein